MENFSQHLNKINQDLLSLKSYKDIVKTFEEDILRDESISQSYPTLSIYIFDRKSNDNNDKYKDSFVIDYQFNWLSNNIYNKNFSALNQVDLYHNSQYHLYLFFKNTRYHVASTIGKFILRDDKKLDEVFAQIDAFNDNIFKQLDAYEFLGYKTAYDESDI